MTFFYFIPEIELGEGIRNDPDENILLRFVFT